MMGNPRHGTASLRPANVVSPRRRIWGIDLIGAFWGGSAMLAAWSCLGGSSAERAFGIIVIPLCLVLSVGMFWHVRLVRILLLILLGLDFVMDGLFAIYFSGMLAGTIEASPLDNPKTELLATLARAGIALAMFFYLRRGEVKQAFQRFSAG